MFQYIQWLSESCTAVADIGCKGFDSLDIVSVDVQSWLGNGLNAIQRSSEITRKTFDKDVWSSNSPTKSRLVRQPCVCCIHISTILWLDFTNSFRKVARATISKVIAIDACQDNIVKTPSWNSLGGVFWLVGIQCFWFAVGFHRAEAATSCTLVTHQHDRSSGRLMFA